MNLKLYRYSSQSKTTLGVLHIDNEFECYTLEDRHRQEKIKGETRIPKGNYRIKLRNFGGHYERYSEKYTYHKGMLWLQDVENFEHILIHIGNYAEDTDGCILVGESVNNNVTDTGMLSNSTNAYLKMYFKVLEAFENDEDVFIDIVDLD